jgi:hypothetical protein
VRLTEHDDGMVFDLAAEPDAGFPYIRLTAPIVVLDKVRLTRNPLRASIGA